MLEILLTIPGPRSAWAISPVSSLLIVYVVLMVYTFKSNIKGLSGGLVSVNLLIIWGVVEVLLRDDGFFRYIGFTIRDGLIFYISSFLVIVVGSIYFALLKEFKKPNGRFRLTYGITSVASLCAVIVLLLLVEIGPDPDQYYPFLQAPEFMS